jgi:hypothetical protein
LLLQLYVIYRIHLIKQNIKDEFQMPLLETPKRGRPKQTHVMDTLSARLPNELVAQIDRYADRLKSQLPGLNVTRADAIRQLLAMGLKVEMERLDKAGAP